MPESAGTDALRDIRSTFEQHGLGEPPLPAALTPRLVRLDKWLWSTRELDRAALYDPELFLREASTPVDDYVAIGETGHGANSWFLTYQAVVGCVGLFVQEGWAGVYMDEPAQAEVLRRRFARVARLLDLVRERRVGGRRLVVIVSPAKCLDVCEWVALDGRAPIRALERALAPKGIDAGREATALGRAVEALLGIEPAGRTVSSTVDLSIRVAWSLAGEVTRTDGRVRFPAGLGHRPALYRLRFIDRPGPWIYIGETEDLARRAHQYERGDRSQRTNARINDLIHQHLDDNGGIELDVALEASLTLEGEPPRAIAMASKLERVLAEHAAIAHVPHSQLLNHTAGSDEV
jgi:hypothetical protein